MVVDGGEERESWPGVNGVSAWCQKRGNWEGRGGGGQLCKDGKDLNALAAVSHTLHSFLIFQRGESTC